MACAGGNRRGGRQLCVSELVVAALQQHGVSLCCVCACRGVCVRPSDLCRCVLRLINLVTVCTTCTFKGVWSSGYTLLAASVDSVDLGSGMLEPGEP